MDRPNTTMAAVIDAGLRMNDKQAALAYFVKNSVPERVIARVLSAPASSKRQTAYHMPFTFR
jgi:hypothetical protein